MAPATYSINGWWPPKATAPTRGANRQPPPLVDATSELSKWVDEATFLFDRAHTCLSAAMAKAAAEGGILPENIENILSGILGKDHNPADHKKVLEVFDQLRSIRRVEIDKPHVLLFRFNTGAVSLGPSGGLELEIPVALDRIGGRYTPGRSTKSAFSDDLKSFRSRDSIRTLKNDP
ncbi:hypothetical protein MMC28_010044 [Mycoblastus sanguinarius]|nr:hypothetical protein [Mycoblastus sanguinarius]